jgi:hypothetical protein
VGDLGLSRKQHKSPVLAVLLSIVPGLGQMYNEQIGKGLVIMILCFVILLAFVGGGLAIGGPDAFGSRLLDRPFGWELHRWGLIGFPRMFGLPAFPSLTLALLITVIYCYAIFDAAITASRINRGELVLHKPRSPRPEHRAIPSIDEELRKGAAAAMNAPEPAQPQTPSSESGKKPSLRERGKASHMARMGWVLIIVGLILWGEIADIWWLSVEHSWPLIPLLFGIRLLFDYRRYQESSQLLVGLIFTAVGAYFLLNQIELVNDLFRQARNFWPLCLVALGVYLIWVSSGGQKSSDLKSAVSKAKDYLTRAGSREPKSNSKQSRNGE